MNGPTFKSNGTSANFKWVNWRDNYRKCKAWTCFSLQMIKTTLNWITATVFSIAPAICPMCFEDLTQNHISCVIWLHWPCMCYKTQYHSLAGLVLPICTSCNIYVNAIVNYNHFQPGTRLLCYTAVLYDPAVWCQTSTCWELNYCSWMMFWFLTILWQFINRWLWTTRVNQK